MVRRKPGLRRELECASGLLAVVFTAAGCIANGGPVEPGTDADASTKAEAEADAGVAHHYVEHRRAPRETTGAAAGREGDDGGEAAWDAANSTPSCVPAAEPDVPDDDFADTNCDGIDGDASSAVFVAPGLAPDGGSFAAGTREAPVGSIQAALQLAKDQQKSAVYVCTGTYEESVVVRDGIDIHGGFDCERSWKRTRDVSVVRVGTGRALFVDGVKLHVGLHSLVFETGRMTAPGVSSIAVSVSRSESVLFDKVDLVSRDAGGGSSGEEVAVFWKPVNAAQGNDVNSSAHCRLKAFECGAMLPNPACSQVSLGGEGEPRTCPDGTVVWGGRGGRGGNCGLGIAAELGAEGNGANGQDGVSGRAGQSFGRIEAGNYVPSSGDDGSQGANGIAGRGGNGAEGADTIATGGVAAYFTIGGGGGQGGYPGCGAPGGKAGQGGGASIALVIEQSKVRVGRSRIVTGRGGDGGAASPGGAGQPGSVGGRGGTGAEINPGANGTAGGNGGFGGAGGPGGGGPSIGIAHVGEAPVLEDVVFELGEPGIGGAGAVTAPDGAKADVFSVPFYARAR